jgi:hypothetical protein
VDYELELEPYGGVSAEWGSGWEGESVECREKGVRGYT